MSSRITSTLLRVPVVGPGGKMDIEYVDRPSLWQEIAFNWQTQDAFGRFGMVLNGLTSGLAALTVAALIVGVIRAVS
jgi:hypothetical protein